MQLFSQNVETLLIIRYWILYNNELCYFYDKYISTDNI